MHEFLAKIARHAFGKGAAFCYAVTVAVSGQLAYSYLQPRDPTPVPAAVAVQPSYPAPHAGPAFVAPLPGATSLETAPVPRSGAAQASLAAAPAKSVSAVPVATAPILPEPPSLSLPSPAALPAPVLKPTALPANRPPAATPAATAIEPSPAPVEPAEKPAGSTIVKPAPPPDKAAPRNRAAEMTHPEAAQLPGNPDTAPDISIAAPIPLLPSSDAAEAEKIATPVRPGPGSGGLY